MPARAASQRAADSRITICEIPHPDGGYAIVCEDPEVNRFDLLFGPAGHYEPDEFEQLEVKATGKTFSEVLTLIAKEEKDAMADWPTEPQPGTVTPIKRRTPAKKAGAAKKAAKAAPAVKRAPARSSASAAVKRAPAKKAAGAKKAAPRRSAASRSVRK